MSTIHHNLVLKQVVQHNKPDIVIRLTTLGPVKPTQLNLGRKRLIEEKIGGNGDEKDISLVFPTNSSNHKEDKQATLDATVAVQSGLFELIDLKSQQSILVPSKKKEFTLSSTPIRGWGFGTATYQLSWNVNNF
ncbi:hypothetical protein MMC06_002723 [Schaereria dolodes]|nr:hypothetical protein [Schaereria dolodes]